MFPAHFMRAPARSFASTFALTLPMLVAGCAEMRVGQERGFIAVSDIAQVPESDPFTAREVKVVGDSLKFFASYGGGCGDHAFTLYASRAGESPDSALLYVQHDAGSDPCRSWVPQRPVAFGLKGLKGDLGVGRFWRRSTLRVAAGDSAFVVRY